MLQKLGPAPGNILACGFRIGMGESWVCRVLANPSGFRKDVRKSKADHRGKPKERIVVSSSSFIIKQRLDDFAFVFGDFGHGAPSLETVGAFASEFG